MTSEFEEVLNAISSVPKLKYETYIWLYENGLTGRYFVSLKERDIFSTCSRNGNYDRLVINGKVCDILDIYTQTEQYTLERKKDILWN